MIALSDVSIDLLRDTTGRRIMRVVHVQSGVAVEGVVGGEQRVVTRRNELLAELTKRVEAATAAALRRK